MEIIKLVMSYLFIYFCIDCYYILINLEENKKGLGKVLNILSQLNHNEKHKKDSLKKNSNPNQSRNEKSKNIDKIKNLADNHNQHIDLSNY